MGFAHCYRCIALEVLGIPRSAGFLVRKSRDPDRDRFLGVNGYMQSFC